MGNLSWTLIIQSQYNEMDENVTEMSVSGPSNGPIYALNHDIPVRE